MGKKSPQHYAFYGSKQPKNAVFSSISHCIAILNRFLLSAPSLKNAHKQGIF